MALLLIDTYHGNWQNRSPNWPALANARHLGFVGGILKCSDGIWPHEWFRLNWPAIRNAGKDRYATDWFRGAYHFMRFDSLGGTPEQQADCFCRNVEKAGGFAKGDIFPIVDVERQSQGGRNFSATAQEIVEKTSRYTERVKSRTGRPVLLYGRGAMRDLGIKSKMGCRAVWNPGYTDRMPTNGLESTWKRDEILLWQYTDGKVNKTTFPTECPGFGALDCSVFLGTSKENMNSLEVFKASLIYGQSIAGTVADAAGPVPPVPTTASGLLLAGMAGIAIKLI